MSSEFLHRRWHQSCHSEQIVRGGDQIAAMREAARRRRTLAGSALILRRTAARIPEAERNFRKIAGYRPRSRNSTPRCEHMTQRSTEA